MRHFFAPIAGSLLTGLLLAAPLQAAEIIISQKDKKFVPNMVEAKVGDVLTFVNDEERKRHNIYTRAPEFDYLKIKKQKPGDRESVTLKNAGTVEVLCALHPKMKLTIVITE
jgi:plastocyanin